MLKIMDYQQKREEAGLSRAELARRMGFSRPHVANVEAGREPASARFEATFIRAVGADADDNRATLIVEPALRARRNIAAALPALATAATDLGKLQRVLQVALRTISCIIDQAENLAGDITLQTCEFDPQTAADEDVSYVVDYICGVMLELVVDHKFHTLDNEAIDTCLQEWARTVAREAKRVRNRERGK